MAARRLLNGYRSRLTDGLSRQGVGARPDFEATPVLPGIREQAAKSPVFGCLTKNVAMFLNDPIGEMPE